MDQKLDSRQLIEQWLVVERQLNKLARLEQRICLRQRDVPHRTDDFFARLVRLGFEAFSHGCEASQYRLRALLAVKTRHIAQRRDNPARKCFALGFGLGVDMFDCTCNGSAIAMLCLFAGVDVQRIGNGQDAQRSSRDQKGHMADVLPVQLGALRHRREPLTRQPGPGHGIEQRQALPHEAQKPLIGLIRRVVLMNLAVAAKIIHAINVGLITQAVALASAVTVVGFEEIHGLGERIRQQETVNLRVHHKGGGHLLEAFCNSGAETGFTECGIVDVLQPGTLGNLCVGHRRSIDHNHIARVAAVVLQGTTQEVRLILGKQQQGQTLAQRGGFISRMALH
ncbi:hypothetical protein ALP75_202482 [Pseudomonas syringae pv. actinidiae]|nr:hypothetical protein ALP75_202482 [Pseudomonas syringae pv. actinidiae]